MVNNDPKVCAAKTSIRMLYGYLRIYSFVAVCKQITDQVFLDALPLSAAARNHTTPTATLAPVRQDAAVAGSVSLADIKAVKGLLGRVDAESLKSLIDLLGE